MITEPRQQLDAVLLYISNHESKVFKIEPLLKDLDIPHDRDNIMSVVVNLEKHGHIEVVELRYDYPSIKVTKQGIEFILRTSYSESQDVANMGPTLHASTRESSFPTDDEKERLEIMQLTLNIQNLETTLKDYPKVRLEAKLAIIIAIISAIVALLALVIK